VRKYLHLAESIVKSGGYGVGRSQPPHLPGPVRSMSRRGTRALSRRHVNLDGSLRGIPFSAEGATWLAAEELPRVAGEVTNG
jgi:hypothetical protein